MPPRIDLRFTGAGAVPVAVGAAPWAQPGTALIAHDPHGQREKDLLGGQLREIELVTLQERDIKLVLLEAKLPIERGSRRRPIVHGQTFIDLPRDRFEAPGAGHQTFQPTVARHGEEPTARAHLTLETNPHRGSHLFAVEPIRIHAELLVEPQRLLLELGYIDLHAHTSPRREREYSIYLLLTPGNAGYTQPPQISDFGFRISDFEFATHPPV